MRLPAPALLVLALLALGSGVGLGLVLGWLRSLAAAGAGLDPVTVMGLAIGVLVAGIIVAIE